MNRRPKFDDCESYIYVALMLTCDEQVQTINSEQASLIIAANYVLPFRESVGDVFDEVRERTRRDRGRVRIEQLEDKLTPDAQTI